MVKQLFILISLSLAITFHAQETPTYMGKGMIQIQPTVCAGYLFAHKTVTAYFRANAEYYVQDNFSVRTDCHYFIATDKKLAEPIRMNHGLTLGAFVHKMRGQLDFYFGFQPGVAITKTDVDSISNNGIRFSPIITLTPGANYYLNRFLHFHLSIQYVHGKHVPEYGSVLALNELRLSTGLAINFNPWEKKKREKEELINRTKEHEDR